MNIGLLPYLSEPVLFLTLFVTLALSFAAHEMGHAFTADRLGDPTPRRYGRVTLNPIKHLDPFGLLLLVLIGFGFASTPINPQNLSRWGRLMVAAAGPLVNLLIAILVLLVVRSGVLPASEFTADAVSTIVRVNVLLAVLNLLPIPLLDGSRILGALVPPLGQTLTQFERNPVAPFGVMIFLYLFSSQINALSYTVLGGLLRIFG